MYMISNSLFILILILAVIFYVAFILQRKDRVLFGLYKWRDELAIYAMNNENIQDLEEYRYLISMINVEIYLVKRDISITDYYLSTVERTIEIEKAVTGIIEKIKSDDVMCEVFENSFEIFTKYFRKRMFWFYRIVLLPAAIVLRIVFSLEKMLKKGKSYKRKKMRRVINFTLGMPSIYENYVRINKV